MSCDFFSVDYTSEKTDLVDSCETIGNNIIVVITA